MVRGQAGGREGEVMILCGKSSGGLCLALAFFFLERRVFSTRDLVKKV